MGGLFKDYCEIGLIIMGTLFLQQLRIPTRCFYLLFVGGQRRALIVGDNTVDMQLNTTQPSAFWVVVK